MEREEALNAANVITTIVLLVVVVGVAVVVKKKFYKKCAGQASEASEAVRTPVGATTKHFRIARFALN